MIGSHNTFTYFKSTNFFTEMFSKFWRSQDLSIEDQYNNGVRFFDIRILKNKKPGLLKKLFSKGNNIQYWTIGHGKSEFKVNKMFRFNNIGSICEYIESNFPDAYYRIFFEHGTYADKQEFKNEIIGLEMKYFNLRGYGIVKPWINLHHNLPGKLIEYNCKLFNWYPEKSIWENIKHFKLSYTPKRWAKECNKNITQDMIDNKDYIYFFDYIKNSKD